MLLLLRLFSTNSRPSLKIEPPVGHIRQTLRKLFGKYLFVTNTLTCGVMMGAGDIIQQEIEQYRTIGKTKSHDWVRTGRMFVVGLATGPPQHLFYHALDRFMPGRSLRTVSIKIIVDQVIASPFCIALFFFGMGFMEGRNFTDDAAELRRKFWTVYTVDWLVWPPTQFINFYFLPNKYRVTYINIVTMLYNVFLSYMHHVIE